MDTNREENADPRKNRIHRRECLKVNIEQEFFTRKDLGAHQPNTLAKHVRKRIENIDSRGDPFCELVVTILGLIERGDLFSKGGKDCPGGIAGLQAGKERMRGQVFLRFSFVSFQRSVEDGRKVGMRGGCGRSSGHDGFGRRSGWTAMSE